MVKHTFEDGVEGKVCSACRKWRPLVRYTKDKTAKDGLQHRCRRCPERVCANPECRVRAGDCKDHGGPLDKEFGGNHYCKACKVAVDARLNQDLRKGGRRYSSALTAGRMYRARKRNAEGTHTVEETKILRIIYGAQCGACKERRATDVDHVVPLAGGKRHDWGGSDGVGNLQWLCGHCNTEKSDKNANDYRPDGGACARALEALKLYEVRSSAKREMYAKWLIRKLRNQLLPVKLAILEQAKPAKEWLDTQEMSNVSV